MITTEITITIKTFSLKVISCCLFLLSESPGLSGLSADGALDRTVERVVAATPGPLLILMLVENVLDDVIEGIFDGTPDGTPDGTTELQKVVGPFDGVVDRSLE